MSQWKDGDMLLAHLKTWHCGRFVASEEQDKKKKKRVEVMGSSSYKKVANDGSV